MNLIETAKKEHKKIHFNSLLAGFLIGGIFVIASMLVFVSNSINDQNTKIQLAKPKAAAPKLPSVGDGGLQEVVMKKLQENISQLDIMETEIDSSIFESYKLRQGQ